MAAFLVRFSKFVSSARGAWAKRRDFSDAVYGPSVSPSSRWARLEAPALDADNDYWYCVEADGVLHSETAGRVHTRPADGTTKSFTFWASGDDGQGPVGSNRDTTNRHPVFRAILNQKPDFGIHLGDIHYHDIGRADARYGSGSLGDFFFAMDCLLSSPPRERLFSRVPLQYIWDDHDYGPNDSDRTSPSRDAACEFYRSYVPHTGLEESGTTDAVYYFFDYGRCRFIMLDNRSERDPNSDPDGPGKSMLGSAQKTWFKNLLSNSPGKMIFVMSGSPWSGTSNDNWPNFSTEREELANHIKSENLMGRLIMLTADHHNMGIDDGTNNDFSTGTGDGGFAVGQFAPLSSRPSGGQAWRHSEGVSGNRRGQFGLIEVEDDGGDIIAVTMRAMRTLSDTTSEVEEAFRWTLNADVSGS